METDIVQDVQPKKRWFNIGIFSKFLPATTVIIAINVGMFIIMAVRGVDISAPEVQSLIEWGANYRLITLDGEPWRLFTSLFIHIGFIHLLLNMYSLLYIGSLLEPYIDSARFAGVYIACGILASLTSVAMHDTAVSAGASGAIFGMFGLFLALLLTKTIETEDSKKMLANIALLIVLNLFYGMKGDVDNAAHVGGLVTGFLIGCLCKSDLVQGETYRRGYVNLLIMGVAVIGITWMGISMIPNNVKYYMNQMKVFNSHEREALRVYDNLSLNSKEDNLYEINERGIYYWEENLKILNNLKKVSLPDRIENVNKKLENYCNLRINSYLLLSKGVAEDTNKYVPEIEKINKEIDDLVKSLRQ